MTVPTPASFLGSCFLGFIFGCGIAILMTLASISWKLLLLMLALAAVYALAEYLLIHLPFRGLRQLWRRWRGGAQTVSGDPLPHSTWYDIAGFWACLSVPVVASLPNVIQSLGAAR